MIVPDKPAYVPPAFGRINAQTEHVDGWIPDRFAGKPRTRLLTVPNCR